MKKLRVFSGILLVAIIAGGASSALAAQDTWIVGNGVYNTGGNWSGAAAPGAGDAAFFTNANAVAITFSASIGTATNIFLGDGGSFTIGTAGDTLGTTNEFVVAGSTNWNGTGFASTNTVVWSGGTLQMGSKGNNPGQGLILIGDTNSAGTFLVNAGVVIASNTTIGVNGSSSGTLQISGVGTVYSNVASSSSAASGLMLMNGNSGALIVANGGFLYDTSNSVNGASNTVTITGLGSSWTNTVATTLGGSGDSIIISNGARFSNGGSVNLGGATNNTISVIGIGSNISTQTTAGNFYVGSAAGTVGDGVIVSNGVIRDAGTFDASNKAGSLSNFVNVFSGGVITSAQFRMTAGSYGTVTVNSNGLVNCQSLTMGATSLSTAGNGIIVNNGGTLIASVRADFMSGTNSYLTINGGAANFTQVTMGNATLTSVGSSIVVTNGGVLTFLSNLGSASIIGKDFASTATVSVAGIGSTWNVGAQTVTIGDNDTITTGEPSGNNNPTANGNGVLVSGGGLITNVAVFILAAANPNNATAPGDQGSNNYLIVEDGGQLFVSTNVVVGDGQDTSNNLFQVGGAGNTATASLGTSVSVGNGTNAGFNLLVVTNGTLLTASSANIGNGVISADNLANIFAGGLWNSGGSNITVGNGVGASTNGVNVYYGGMVTNVGRLIITSNTGGVDNELTVGGGGVIVSNLNIVAGNDITFSTGTLNVQDTTVESGVNGGAGVVVGDGTDAASLELAAGGLGYHQFADGLVITNNATLRGNGAILGNLTILGTLSPGFSTIGTIVASNNMVLGGAMINYDLGITGGNPTGDLTVVNGNLTLGGTLNVTDAGGFNTATYTLFTYGGALTYNGVAIGTTPSAGLTYAISTSTVGQVNLIVGIVAPPDPFTAWQFQYFGCTNLAVCPQAAGNADPLGKGMSNTNQFLAGFNPTNSAANLRVISIARTNTTDINVIYLGANGDSTRSPSVASRTNVLEYTTGTANGSYSNSFVSTGQTNILSGGTGLGVVTNMVDSGGATNRPARYYRIEVIAP